ncbi:MAG: hypothetical protein PHF00_04045 [Elusimicrobia bacterium]|nr:hypothetical protein [Elusimicrobiota bacterium]
MEQKPKEQKPIIPTLKDSRKPQVKIKGLASGLSLIERLKQFKKKDLAFIMAGLGVLFMAPLAEHFMMSPENADSTAFKPGWGFQPTGRFGDGGSPYENGVNGLAPGGVAGGGSDVITPLNVRDPSVLIMAPGASQQPAATAATPQAPAKESADWKDALANAAAKGAGAATKAAGVPVPKPALTNAGLRGLGAAAGGSGGGFSLPPISAGNVPNKAAMNDSLSRVSKAPGYMGAGARGSENASAGSMEALKKAAAAAGSDFNRSGQASTALEQAASHAMPTGSGAGGAGQGGMGRDDKGPGGNQEKGGKSLGESLAFLAMKDEMQKARDLKWKLKEKEAMLWPNLKEKLAEELVMTPAKALTKGFTDLFDGFGGDKTSYVLKCGNETFPFSKFPSCGEGVKSGYCIQKGLQSNTYDVISMPGGSVRFAGCTKEKGDSDKDKPSETGSPVGGITPGSATGGGSLKWACDQLDAAAQVEKGKAERNSLKSAAQAIVLSRNSLVQPANECGISGDVGGNVSVELRAAGALVTGAVQAIVPKAYADLRASAAYLDSVKPGEDGNVSESGFESWQPNAYAEAYQKMQPEAKGKVQKAQSIMAAVQGKLAESNTQIGQGDKISEDALGKGNDAAKVIGDIKKAYEDTSKAHQTMAGEVSKMDGAVNNALPGAQQNWDVVRANVQDIGKGAAPGSPNNGIKEVSVNISAGDSLNVAGFKAEVQKAKSQYPESNDQQSGNREKREQAIRDAKGKLENYRDGARKQNGSSDGGVYKQFQGVETQVKDVVGKLPGGSAAKTDAAAKGK